MEKRFLEVIEANKLTKKGERIIVACSGGADSVALLVLLNKFKNELGIEPVALHVNHNIRGAESDRDEGFVRNLAKQLGVLCVVKSVDAVGYASEKKKTLEQSARELRYGALREAKEELGAEKIAVAHNKNDQAETLLMHLFRGAGLQGLTGMSFISGDIIRPLLWATKSEIVDYLEAEKIEYVEDSTNKDLNYARNFVRHKLLKEAEQVYPGVYENLLRFSAKLQETQNYLTNLVPKHLLVKKRNLVLVKNEAKDIDWVLLKQLLFLALQKADARVDVEEKHLLEIIRLFSAQVGKRLSLPNGVEVIKTYEGLEFQRENEEEFIPQPFSANGVIKTSLGEILVKPTRKRNFVAGVNLLDVDKIPATAVWRNIKMGDKFTKFSGGTKTLSKFLVDKKIGVNIRKKMVILADGDECLAVPGVEISSLVKLTEDTKHMVSIELKKG